MWRTTMPFKVDREDIIDTMWTKFTVEVERNGQGVTSEEFMIPVWDADDFENKVNGYTDIDFRGWKDKVGKKNARPGQ